jgi:hypothetical protein
MSSRAFTAAMTTMLLGSAGMMMPALAQGIIADTLSAENVPAALEEGAPFALGSGLFGAEEFSLFPVAPEWGVSISGFAVSGATGSTSGHYARVPSYGLLPAANLVDETIELRDIFVSAPVLPGFDLDFARWNYAPASVFAGSAAAGLHDNPVIPGTALRSPYAGLGESGLYAGATIALTSNIDFHFGRASSTRGGVYDLASPLPNDLAMQMRSGTHAIETTSLGFDWNVTDWADLGFTASQTVESGPVLGAVGTPVASATDSAAIGISARVGFGEGWVTTVAYNEGVSQLRVNAHAGQEPLRSQSYGFSLSKQGVFGDDALGFTVSRPLQTYGGTNFASISLASVLNRDAGTVAPESDFELGYVTTFMDGALALQANAAYQVNAKGEEGQDAVSVLSRARIRF